MNGVHDLGGMHGMGTVVVEPDEPVFHHEWEGRVFAMCWATFITYFPVDETRAAIERIPPDRYLGSSYYERWLLGLEMLLVKHGHLSLEEIEARVRALQEAA
jgi:hypothetical protein